MEALNKEIINVFKAIADESRISIIKLLSEGESCACGLLERLSLSQPTLSHHMKVLCESGIVVSRKEGTWVFYTLAPDFKEKICGYIDELIKPAE